nr:reverse transcriptase domain-containing protein [Tanacetum cinerariifolium]
QDKYVAEILRKFGLSEGKSASTPIDAEKPLLKDSNGKDVDVHTYRVFNSPMLHVLRVEMVINSPWMLSKNWLVQKQTALGKDTSNPFMADNLPKIVWFSTHHISCMKSWLVQKQTALGVNTPRSDEDRLKLMELMVFVMKKGVCDEVELNAARLSKFLLSGKYAARAFEQIIDFLSGSYINHALTVNPYVYISCIKQFWNTAVVKRSGDVTSLQALVDKKRIVITVEVVLEILQLNDVEGVICLPNDEIFAGLARMGYEQPKQTTNVVEPEFRTIVEMADNRTMAQMLQAPIEGYEDAIVVPQINANNSELKQMLINLVQSNQFTGRQDPHNHLRFFNKVTSTFRHPEVPNTTIKLLLFPFSLEGEARIWLDKEPPRLVLTWEDLVSKFINQFFPPSKTTYLWNEILNFLQKPNETFNEAWEHFKDLLRQCPHHGFLELNQLDTFYNALNPNDQDALDFAAGDFLDKIPRECLSIIESKSKVRYSRSRVTD